MQRTLQFLQQSAPSNMILYTPDQALETMLYMQLLVQGIFAEGLELQSLWNLERKACLNNK